MLHLRCPTSPTWTEAVLADFDAFLVDHAACERKASATGMSFIVRYPDRTALLEPLIAFAREELEHFHDVYRLIEARGLALTPDTPDPYVQPLIASVRTGRETRLLDRLLVAGVVEARGCERFGLIAEAHPDPDMRAFYRDVTRAEARHHALFVRLARHYFSEQDIEQRLNQILVLEADVVTHLTSRPALH